MTNKPCLLACFFVKRRSMGWCFGVLLFGVLLVTSSCETNQNDIDNWDRSAMLSHWSNEIIVPAWYQFANTSLEAAHAADTFALRLDSTHFEILRSKYQTACGSWQKVSLF